MAGFCTNKAPVVRHTRGPNGGRMRNARALTAALAALVPATAEAGEVAHFASKGTTMLQGTLEVSSNDSESDIRVEGVPDTEHTERTDKEFVVGPLLTHFIADGFAIAFGGTIAHSSTETDDESEDFTTYGVTFGPYYYGEINPALFGAIGLRVSAAKGSGEEDADGETTDTTVGVFGVQAEVGLAFPFGNGGVLEAWAFMRRHERETEYSFPGGRVDVDSVNTSLGLGLNMGLVF